MQVISRTCETEAQRLQPVRDGAKDAAELEMLEGTDSLVVLAVLSEDESVLPCQP